MVSKLTIPGAFDHHYTNCKMESRVEKLERILLEERKVNPTRLEEIQQLWKRRKGYNFRQRSRRDHAPSRHRRTLNGLEFVSELIDHALLLTKKNDTLNKGGLAVEDAEMSGTEDSEPLVAQGSSNLQQWGIDLKSQISSEIAEKMNDMEEEEDGGGGEGPITNVFSTVKEIETHMEGELKANRVFSKEEEKLEAAHVKEIEVESDSGDVLNISEMTTKNQSGGRSRNDGNCCVGGGGGSLVEIMSRGVHVTPSPASLDMGVPKAEVELSSGMEVLPPPEPPDLGVNMEEEGSIVSAEGGSPPGVYERPQSTPADPPDQNAAMIEFRPSHAMVAGSSPFKVSLPRAADFNKSMETQLKERVKMRLQRNSQFFNLLGQAQQDEWRITILESRLGVFHARNETKHSETKRLATGPSLTCTQPIRANFTFETVLKHKAIRVTKTEGQPKEGGYKHCVGAELCEFKNVGELSHPSWDYDSGQIEEACRKANGFHGGKHPLYVGIQTQKLHRVFLNFQQRMCYAGYCWGNSLVSKIPKSSVFYYDEGSIVNDFTAAQETATVSKFPARGGSILVPRGKFSQFQLTCLLFLSVGIEDIHWDPGGDYYSSSTIRSLCFKQWNPGRGFDGTSQSSMKGNNTKRQYAATSMDQNLNVAKFARQEVLVQWQGLPNCENKLPNCKNNFPILTLRTR